MQYWLKRNGSSGSNEVVIGRDDPDSTVHWWSGITTLGLPTFTVRDSSGISATIIGTTTITDNNWHLITGTYDAGTIRLFVDGAHQATASPGYTGTLTASGVPVNIGWLNLLSGYHFQGTMDELAFYDSALNLENHTENYFKGTAGYGYGESLPRPPIIISSPEEQSVPSAFYSYSPVVSAYPEATLSLSDGPSGMIYNTPTESFEWTPNHYGIYNVEIQADNSAGSTSQSYNVTVLDLPDFIYSYWTFDEGSGIRYADIINGYDAQTAINTPAPATVAGIVGNALQFSSSTGLEVANASVYDFTSSQSLTVEAWIQRDQSTVPVTVNEVITGRYYGNVSWWVGISSVSPYQLAFIMQDSDGTFEILRSVTPVADGTSRHVVCTYDASAQQMKIFVDGRLETFQATSFSGNFNANGAPLHIGRLPFSSEKYNYRGLLDELAIYKGAPSEAEIADHFNKSSNTLNYGYTDLTAGVPVIVSTPPTFTPVGVEYQYSVLSDGAPAAEYELLTAPTGMTVDPGTGLISWTPSASGNYTITLNAYNPFGNEQQTYTLNVTNIPAGLTAVWAFNEPFANYKNGVTTSPVRIQPGMSDALKVDGIFGPALSFNGTDGHLYVTPTTGFNWADGESFSIEAFFRKNTLSEKVEVITGRKDPQTSALWWVGVSPFGGGIPTAFFQAADGETVHLFGTTPATDGTAHHTVIVYNAPTETLTLYVDGVAEDSRSARFNGGFTSDYAPLTLGRIDLPGEYRYKGELDDLALYNAAITPAEISDRYNQLVQAQQ